MVSNTSLSKSSFSLIQDIKYNSLTQISAENGISQFCFETTFSLTDNIKCTGLPMQVFLMGSMGFHQRETLNLKILSQHQF